MNIKATKLKVTASGTEEVKARFNSQGRMADGFDATRRDAIGVLLKGEHLETPVLITYNRLNNTFYENFNVTIISEVELAFGVWKTFTAEGLSRIKALRRLYEKKMPERLRELQIRLRGDMEIDTDAVKDITGVGVREQRGIGKRYDDIDDALITDYDLDTLRAVASDMAEADCSSPIAVYDAVTLNDAVTRLTVAFMTYGFNLKPMPESATEKFRSYQVSYGGSSLYSAVDNSNYESIQNFNKVLGLALTAANWVACEGRFPISSGNGKLVWHMQTPTAHGSIFATLNLQNSTLLVTSGS